MDKFEWINEYNRRHGNEYEKFMISGKYLAIYYPEHPKSRKDGIVYIHQLEAEKILGRHLKDGECVHHIDENKFNNDSSNLMIFKTNSDHISFHGGGTPIFNGETWECIPNTNSVCPECGKSKTYQAKVCLECYLKQKHSKSNIPPKDELEANVRLHSFVKLGKMYGVTDNAVRKWCRYYGIPYKRNKSEVECS